MDCFLSLLLGQMIPLGFNLPHGELEEIAEFHYVLSHNPGCFLVIFFGD
jgi:hypothetical protein